MKVFNYSDGKKGEILGTISMITGTSAMIGVINGITVHDRVYGRNDDDGFNADRFGVDMILMCMGQDVDSQEWEWLVVPSSKLINKGKKRNQKLFGSDWYDQKKAFELRMPVVDGYDGSY